VINRVSTVEFRQQDALREDGWPGSPALRFSCLRVVVSKVLAA